MIWILLAHFWGDYILQTDDQAADKPHCWRAMSRHISSYHLPMTFAVLVTLGSGWQASVFLIVSVVTHVFFDRRWPVIRLLEITGSTRFAETPAGVHIVDQLLHVTILAVTYTALT